MESKTEEEGLRADNFVLKRENAGLKEKLADTWDKNKKWADKDAKSDKTKAELRAEIIRLESRNIKTTQDLKDIGQKISNLKDRVAELETLCQKQSEEIRAGERRYDEYIQSVSSLTSLFRRAPPEDTTSQLPSRTTKFGDEENRHSEAQRSSITDSVLQMSRAQRSEVMISQALTLPTSIKSEHERHKGKDIQSEHKKSTVPNQTPERDFHPHIPYRPHAEQRLLDAKTPLQRRSQRPEESSTKRLPDEDLDDLMAKRRRQEPQHSAHGPGRASDPRLQYRRA